MRMKSRSRFKIPRFQDSEFLPSSEISPTATMDPKCKTAKAFNHILDHVLGKEPLKKALVYMGVESVGDLVSLDRDFVENLVYLDENHKETRVPVYTRSLVWIFQSYVRHRKEMGRPIGNDWLNVHDWDFDQYRVTTYRPEVSTFSQKCATSLQQPSSPAATQSVIETKSALTSTERLCELWCHSSATPMTLQDSRDHVPVSTPKYEQGSNVLLCESLCHSSATPLSIRNSHGGVPKAKEYKQEAPQAVLEPSLDYDIQDSHEALQPKTQDDSELCTDYPELPVTASMSPVLPVPVLLEPSVLPGTMCTSVSSTSPRVSPKVVIVKIDKSSDSPQSVSGDDDPPFNVFLKDVLYFDSLACSFVDKHLAHGIQAVLDFKDLAVTQDHIGCIETLKCLYDVSVSPNVPCASGKTSTMVETLTPFPVITYVPPSDLEGSGYGRSKICTPWQGYVWTYSPHAPPYDHFFIGPACTLTPPDLFIYGHVSFTAEGCSLPGLQSQVRVTTDLGEVVVKGMTLQYQQCSDFVLPTASVTKCLPLPSSDQYKCKALSVLLLPDGYGWMSPPPSVSVVPSQPVCVHNVQCTYGELEGSPTVPAPFKERGAPVEHNYGETSLSSPGQQYSTQTFHPSHKFVMCKHSTAYDIQCKVHVYKGEGQGMIKACEGTSMGNCYSFDVTSHSDILYKNPMIVGHFVDYGISRVFTDDVGDPPPPAEPPPWITWVPSMPPSSQIPGCATTCLPPLEIPLLSSLVCDSKFFFFWSQVRPSWHHHAFSADLSETSGKTQLVLSLQSYGEANASQFCSSTTAVMMSKLKSGQLMGRGFFKDKQEEVRVFLMHTMSKEEGNSRQGHWLDQAMSTRGKNAIHVIWYCEEPCWLCTLYSTNLQQGMTMGRSTLCSLLSMSLPLQFLWSTPLCPCEWNPLFVGPQLLVEVLLHFFMSDLKLYGFQAQVIHPTGRRSVSSATLHYGELSRHVSGHHRHPKFPALYYGELWSQDVHSDVWCSYWEKCSFAQARCCPTSPTLIWLENAMKTRISTMSSETFILCLGLSVPTIEGLSVPSYISLCLVITFEQKGSDNFPTRIYMVSYSRAAIVFCAQCWIFLSVDFINRYARFVRFGTGMTYRLVLKTPLLVHATVGCSVSILVVEYFALGDSVGVLIPPIVLTPSFFDAIAQEYLFSFTEELVYLYSNVQLMYDCYWTHSFST
jgi:hypothetical protein